MRRRVIAPPQPAAGAGVTVSVPEASTWTLLSVAFRLVTSATVQTRTPLVAITDGTGFNIGGAVSGFGQTAGSTADFLFSHGVAEWDQSNNAVASGGLPRLLLDGGDSVVITIGNIDTTDQVSRVRVVVMQDDNPPQD